MWKKECAACPFIFSMKLKLWDLFAI